MSDDPPGSDGPTDGGDSVRDEPLVDRVERLHGALRATEERPVEREASRWIGEAQAVAGDAAELAETEGADAVVRERVGRVAELLSHVESTGDEAADERIATARAVASGIADRDETED